MSFAARFKAGSDIAGNLLNTYDAARRKKDMAEIAGATEITAYGPDDAAQIDAAAKAVGPDGKPYYTVGNDAAGNYTITPNFQNETGEVPTDYAPSTLAAKGVSFLGKNYNAPLTETQMTGARQQAMAGVMERGGDVEGAMRYRELAQQGVRNAAQDARLVTQDARQVTQDARQGVLDKRNDDQYAEAEQYKQSKRAIDEQNPQALVERNFAAANAKFQTDQAAYDKLASTPGANLAEVGAAPTAPTKGGVTPGQQMAYYAQVVANEHKFGKLNVTDMMNFDAMRKKLDDEGYVKTLKAAHAGASMPELVKLFGEKGQEKFDPALVASDTVGKNAAGMPTRIITFKDGRVLDTLKELESLDAADKLVARFYQGKTDKRADATSENEAARLLIAQKGLTLTQAASTDAKTDRTEKKAEKTFLADASVALYQELNPAATAVQLEAVRRGVIPAIKTEGKQTPEGLNTTVNAMNALIAQHSDVMKTPRGSTPEEKQAWQKTLDTAVNLRDRAVVQLEIGLAGREAKSPTPAQPPSREASGKVTNLPEYKTRALAEAAAKAGLLKTGDRVSIGGRIATLN